MTVAVTTATPAPLLVAYREGVAGDWKPVTGGMITVTGPYELAVVCQPNAATWATTVTANAPVDAKSVDAGCAATPATHIVSGTVVQAGQVNIGGQTASGTTANWAFTFTLPAGKYDLAATDGTKVLLQKAVNVSTADVTALALDIGTGAALTTVKLSTDNKLGASAKETYVAEVKVQSAPDVVGTTIFSGDVAATKIAPDSLLADPAVQTVTFSGHHNVTLVHHNLTADDDPAAPGNSTVLDKVRSLTRPFKAAEAAKDSAKVFTLPAGLGDVAWQIQNNQLTTIASSSSADVSTVSVAGTAGDGKAASYTIRVSSKFVSGTKFARPVFDTSIPSYQAAWKVDYSKAYSRTASGFGAVAKTQDVGSWTTTEQCDDGGCAATTDRVYGLPTLPM